MSVDTPPSGSGATPLREHIQALELNSSSPLMRTVTREIAAIELALSRGVTYKQIAAAIGGDGGNGGTTNPKTLRECVYRVRKRRAQRLASIGPTTPPAPLGTPAPVSSDVSVGIPAVVLPKLQAKPIAKPPAEPVAPHAAASSQSAAPATDPEVITRIRSSMRDLDMLAWQFRESQRKASTAAAPPRDPWTPSGIPTAELPAEPGEHST